MPSQSVDVTVVVPCFNEETVLPSFHRRMLSVMAELPSSCEILYIDDGSTDQTFQHINGFCLGRHVRGIRFSRNFGKESAIQAGIDHAKGQAIILIDADLQDPPELIPDMIAAWKSGFDVVNMQRECRGKEGLAKRFSAKLFYRTIAKLNGRLHYPNEVSDFRLIGKEVIDSLKQTSESSRSFKSMVSWCGYKSIELQYKRDERFAGETKWNLWSLSDLAIESIMSVSRKPLRLFSFSAAFLFFVCIFLNLYSFWQGAFSASVFALLVISFLGLGLAMIGEYLGAAYQEIKGRPGYLIADTVDSESMEAENAGPASYGVFNVVSTEAIQQCS
ncbi:glycosyltransferase family 2 protein [Pseudoteredinibacter isoporae]|uniref:Glycosyltransferase involved in cell wall biosynthesis n=1 Tax=Pseudoteredinibacter isoporae TaxID=570281 RepID=A0A7X0JRJ6_9GAMM|nr:glycosyltransferase family 2 protein [Pseudoteredinibacter isoporae]MBB6520075.1 glycosyltransferase involved in cell wall biosynthesis [Pseudoteredinibacter isoporae]NHO85647.1 glycosyltransferase family 2 protein [Pseudoteredinibacter isoporae]NIB25901.1 glycosyltransferase family 2 protein [Pseudoteredinibacter isoporae]